MGDDSKFAELDDAEPVNSSEPETPMPAIIKQNIGGKEVNAVNARELHARLQAKTKFSDWIKRRIEDYGFIDGVDFICFLEKEKAGNNASSKQYIMNLEMAKEIAIVEKITLVKKLDVTSSNAKK